MIRSTSRLNEQQKSGSSCFYEYIILQISELLLYPYYFYYCRCCCCHCYYTMSYSKLFFPLPPHSPIPFPFNILHDLQSFAPVEKHPSLVLH